MTSFKQKIIFGASWNLVNVIFKQVLTISFVIILARLLSPADFGLIGMISIFIELSLRLQGAGLGETLIRQNNCTQADYNYVFYYGLIVNLICYLLLFFIAPIIARFFSQEKLVWVIRIITLSLFFMPLRGVNQIQMIKTLNFHWIARIEILENTTSGIIAIFMAWMGFGVWSLVARHLCRDLTSTLLFSGVNRWIPTLSMEKQRSKKLFLFGSRLMISNFIDSGFRNIYNLIIGKQYSAQDLGYYSQGKRLQQLPSNSVNAIVRNVSFPALAILRSEKNYRTGFRTAIKLLTFINFPLMVCLAVIADPLIPLVLSDKWTPCIPFFRLLLIIGLMEPIKSQFVSILKVEGKGNLLIGYAAFTKLFYLIGILITFRLNIYILVISQIIAAVFELLVYTRVGRLVQYSTLDLLKDIVPNVTIALGIGAILTASNAILPVSDPTIICLDVLIAFGGMVALSVLTRNPNYFQIIDGIKIRLKG